MECTFDNSCSPQPVYEQVAKVLNISLENTKERLLTYYWNIIESKQRKEILPIAKKLTEQIASTDIEHVDGMEFFRKDCDSLKLALMKIRELQSKKKLEDFRTIKTRLDVEESPASVFKSKLTSQILSYLNQKDNAELKDAIARKLNVEVPEVGPLLLPRDTVSVPRFGECFPVLKYEEQDFTLRRARRIFHTLC